MATHWSNKPGINHVGEFQVSGHTFVVTGSGDIIKLKFVANLGKFEDIDNFDSPFEFQSKLNSDN